MTLYKYLTLRRIKQIYLMSGPDTLPDYYFFLNIHTVIFFVFLLNVIWLYKSFLYQQICNEKNVETTINLKGRYLYILKVSI